MFQIIKPILIVTVLSILNAKQDNTKLDFQYKLKKFDALRMYFDIGIGNLVLTPSNNRYILTSDIHYNPNLKKPIINLSDKNNIAKLDVKINPHKNFNKENSKTLFNNLMEDGSDNYKLNFQFEYLPQVIQVLLNHFPLPFLKKSFQLNHLYDDLRPGCLF